MPFELFQPTPPYGGRPAASLIPGILYTLSPPSLSPGFAIPHFGSQNNPILTLNPPLSQNALSGKGLGDFLFPSPLSLCTYQSITYFSTIHVAIYYHLLPSGIPIFSVLAYHSFTKRAISHTYIIPGLTYAPARMIPFLVPCSLICSRIGLPIILMYDHQQYLILIYLEIYNMI